MPNAVPQVPAEPVSENDTGGPMLAIGDYRASLRAVDVIRLPAYPGSAWRGLFGHSLRRAVCVTRQPTCEGCLLRGNCVYAYLFETPTPPDAAMMRRYPSVPHPFVLAPKADGEKTLKPGTIFSLPFRLFGKGNAHLPYVVHSLQRGGEYGIGRGDGRFVLEEVEQWVDGRWQTIFSADCAELAAQPAEVPEAPDVPDRLVRLVLETPLRIKRDGGLVGGREFEFHDLFRNLLRRLSALSYFHGDRPLTLDFAGLVKQARDVVPLHRDVRWQDWTRYSSRQRTSMKMGGLVGEVIYRAADLAPFWPLLWAGQWTHAGKAASMGLGRYRLTEAASLPDGTEQSKAS